MTARTWFHRMMAERRQFERGSPEWAYRTRAARQFLEILRKPVVEWNPK